MACALTIALDLTMAQHKVKLANLVTHHANFVHQELTPLVLLVQIHNYIYKVALVLQVVQLLIIQTLLIKHAKCALIIVVIFFF